MGTPLRTDPKYIRLSVAANGTIFLLQPYTPVIQRFSDNGGTSKEIGRKGSGPGEYLLPAWMGLVADTLWVYDVGTRRLTMVSSLGSGRAMTIPFSGGARSGIAVSSIAALAPNGTAIATSGGDARLTTIGNVQRRPLLRTLRDGSKVLDTVAMLSTQHSVRMTTSGPNGTTRTTEEPFSDKSVWGVSPNGQFVAVVTQPDGAAGHDVSLYRFDGSRVYSAPIPFPRVAITTSDAQAILNERYDVLLEQLGDRQAAVPTRAEFARGVFMPRFRVPVSDVVVGDDGTVVLRGNDWSGKLVEYVWMTPRGVPTGSMTLPRQQHLRAVRGNRFWSTVETDEGEIRIVRQDLVSAAAR